MVEKYHLRSLGGLFTRGGFAVTDERVDYRGGGPAGRKGFGGAPERSQGPASAGGASDCGCQEDDRARVCRPRSRDGSRSVRPHAVRTHASGRATQEVGAKSEGAGRG